MSPSSPIDALLFDVGGVVIDIDFELALGVWATMSSLSLDEIRARFRMDTAYERHERGEIHAPGYFAHLRETLALEASDADIESGWNAIYVGTIDETIEDVRAARQHLPCFAFTNSNPTHQRESSARFPEASTVFDRVFVSSELGLRKPEREAFDAISNAVGIDLSRMLFFDDTEENIDGARVAGLQTVLVTSPADVRRALREVEALIPAAPVDPAGRTI